jgi:hypothetical protein
MGQHRSRGRRLGACRTRRDLAAPAGRTAEPAVRGRHAGEHRGPRAAAGEHAGPAAAGAARGTAGEAQAPGAEEGQAAACRAGGHAADDRRPTAGAPGCSARARAETDPGSEPGPDRKRPSRPRVRGAVAGAGSSRERVSRPLAVASRRARDELRRGDDFRSARGDNPLKAAAPRPKQGARRCKAAPEGAAATAAGRRPPRRRRPSFECPRAGRRSSRPGRAG